MEDLAIRLQKAAATHCAPLALPHDLGLVLVGEVFRSDGDEEDRWCKHMELACPHCGGSGHKDDVAEKPGSN